MSRPRRIRSADLALTCAVAAVGLIVSLLQPGGWLQAIAVTPLVLVACGYAITAALFPPGTIEAEDRPIYTFVFSISAVGVGGLLLHFFLDLDRGAWLGLLTLLTVGASALAQRRRAMGTAPRSTRLTPAPPSRRALWALAFLTALAMAAGSIAIATEGIRDQQGRQHFVSLWALPADGAVDVGVWSHGVSGAFRLEASSAGRRLESIRLDLASDQKWRGRLEPAVPLQAFQLVLYRGSKPYRSVELNIGEPE